MFGEYRFICRYNTEMVQHAFRYIFFCARVAAVWVNTASCEGRENLFTPSSFLEGEVSAAVGSRWMFLFA